MLKILHQFKRVFWVLFKTVLLSTHSICFGRSHTYTLIFGMWGRETVVACVIKVP